MKARIWENERKIAFLKVPSRQEKKWKVEKPEACAKNPFTAFKLNSLLPFSLKSFPCQTLFAYAFKLPALMMSKLFRKAFKCCLVTVTDSDFIKGERKKEGKLGQ